MIKKKKIGLFILIAMVVVCIAGMPHVASAETKAKEGLMNYTVSIDVNGKGKLYWDYGKNMTFFLENSPDTFPAACKVKSNVAYKFSKLVDRGLLAVPNDDAYFTGFYNQEGKSVQLTKTKIDILRVSVNGVYFYDYYDAYDNAKFSKITEAAYKKKVKAYVKTLYGTSRYKVIDSAILYEVPKKDATYIAKFKQKTHPKVSFRSSIVKTYGNAAFYAIPSRPSAYTYQFKSSNRKVLTIDKSSGYVKIQGPGTAVITCTIAETEKTLPSKLTIKVTVKPGKIKELTAIQNQPKQLQVNWKRNTRYSGYIIEASNHRSFSTILARKTITSGRTSHATIKLKTELFHNYVRIRAYKISGNKKIYGPYTIAKIKKKG